ncbi:hypothetical protein HW555_012225 [Spodoptera exigua]|uniref:Uncharacterized protein n=1 Tax=Spodoptera exigua TaxID=7107 RepID=A0A835G7I4_SPOEX|nr:hypothetical protein HW555_012225 [Spodoptera exigua]
MSVNYKKNITMFITYFLLFITLQNINCYKSTQNPTNNIKHLSSKPDQVVPARYKVTSKTNYDNPTQGFPSEYFPEVEYPESIADSSKPFYMNTSPFSDDVKSSFNSLIAQSNKPKPDKSQEKLSPLTHKVKVTDDAKGNEINTNNTRTNETSNWGFSILIIQRITCHGSKTNQSNVDCEEWGLVAELLKDIDEFMTNITIIEQEIQDGNNTTFESEADESALISPNNETIVEFDGNSFNSEGHDQIRTPLFEGLNANDTAANMTSLFNENITDTSTAIAENMQSDFCNIGTNANETNTSCTSS